MQSFRLIDGSSKMASYDSTSRSRGAQRSAGAEGMDDAQIFIMDGFEIGKMLAGNLGGIHKTYSAGIPGGSVGVGRQGAVGGSHGGRAGAHGDIKEARRLGTGRRPRRTVGDNESPREEGCRGYDTTPT